jgi:predicted HicB family RNase H-like nuclease
MEYKGYYATVRYDSSADAFHGRVLGMNDVIDFYGGSTAELRREMETSIEDYLAWCEEEGSKPEKTWQGKLTIRPSESLRRRLVIAAAARGESVNAFVTEALERETRKILGDDVH